MFDCGFCYVLACKLSPYEDTEKGAHDADHEADGPAELRIAELPEDFRVIGPDDSTPLMRKSTGQIEQDGRLTAATIAAKRRLADRRTRSRGAPRQWPTEANADHRASRQVPMRTQAQSVDSILRLRQLEVQDTLRLIPLGVPGRIWQAVVDSSRSELSR